MDFHSSLKEIIQDRTSGSTDIARKTCALLSELRSSEMPDEDVRSILDEILNAHRPMAVLHNCIRHFLSGGSPEKFMRDMEEHTKKASSLALDYLKSIGAERVMTISSSSAVELCLSRFDGKIYVMESRPMLEGIRMAERLSEMGKDVIVVTDAYGISMVAKGEVDAVLTGADAIYHNMVINKVGSYALYAAAKHSGVDFISIATTEKMFPEGVELSDDEIMQFHDPEEITHRVHGVNPYFEGVEIEGIKVFTERGRL